MKSSAHLKTLREACGLSQREAVAYIGKGSLRTWKFWEAHDTELPIKPDVLEALENLLAWQQTRIDHSVDLALEVQEDAPRLKNTFGELVAPPITLTRYRTQQLLDMHHPGYKGGLGSHTKVVECVFRELRASGVDVTMVYDGDGLSGTDWRA